MPQPSKIHWVNALFFTLTPIIALGGTLVWIFQDMVNSATIILATVLWALGALSITAGYHRLYSHKSYRAHAAVKALILFFSSSTFEGPVWVWASDHRNHHKYQDTEKDPYAIQKGFWYAHLFWLFDKRYVPTMDNISDLKKDRALEFQYRYYTVVAIFTAFIFPMLIASLWSDPWGGLFVAGLLRMVLNQHVTFAINSVCHAFGSKPYSLKLTARDNPITAFFTFGEGYHNFHHQFPNDYRNGIYWYHWDPTKWLIWFLGKFGLVSDLKTTPVIRVHQKRMEAQEAYLQAKLMGRAPADVYHSAMLIVKSAKNKYQMALAELEKLNQEYSEIEASRNEILTQDLQVLKKDLKIARQNFNNSVMMWQNMIDGLGKFQHA